MHEISIIIPRYNVEQYIDRCLKSVTSQTIGLDLLEIILINDASTDNTLDKPYQWEHRFPQNIMVITYEENLRQGGARNIGLTYASGQYIGFADADDYGELFDTHFYTTKPALKCIQSGIPLRTLDIMGAGVVLFSNYQPELAECFEDGTDLILYESMEDAIAKADFYLKHEELGKQIAQNRHDKVKKEFSYPKRIEELFRVAGLNL